MRKFLILAFFVVTSNGLSQKKTFFIPPGIYESFEDFKSKKPSSSNNNFTYSQLEKIITTGYQLRSENGKRIKRKFALSNGDKIFVRVSKMKKHFLENNRGNPIDVNRDYSLAYLQNEQFLYFENFFFSTGTALLGVGKMHLRGIIYDSTKEKFIVFKYESDVKRFLEETKPQLLEKYDLNNGKKIDIKTVRLVMLDLFEQQQMKVRF